MDQERTAAQDNPLDGEDRATPKLSLQLTSHGWSSPKVQPTLPRSYVPVHHTHDEPALAAWHRIPIARVPAVDIDVLLEVYETAPDSITEKYLQLRADASKQLFMKLVEHVNANLTKEISVTTLAQAVGLRKASLTRLVRENSGKSIAAFVRERRVSIALSLLRTSHERLGSIAVKCGFSSQSYFSQIIRHKTARSPLEYRRSNLAQLEAGPAR
jgi:AraC-like DNA-binding protein